MSADEKLAYVANAHSDSISVIDIAQPAELKRIALGPEPQLTLAQQGEQLLRICWTCGVNRGNVPGHQSGKHRFAAPN